MKKMIVSAVMQEGVYYTRQSSDAKEYTRIIMRVCNAGKYQFGKPEIMRVWGEDFPFLRDALRECSCIDEGNGYFTYEEEDLVTMDDEIRHLLTTIDVNGEDAQSHLEWQNEDINVFEATGKHYKRLAKDGTEAEMERDTIRVTTVKFYDPQIKDYTYVNGYDPNSVLDRILDKFYVEDDSLSEEGNNMLAGLSALFSK